jgi:hypothetical protein
MLEYAFTIRRSQRIVYRTGKDIGEPGGQRLAIPV